MLDCLVLKSKKNPNGLSIIEDDSPEHIISLNVKPIKCKRGDEKTVILIEY